jgi:hypothetical protein
MEKEWHIRKVTPEEAIAHIKRSPILGSPDIRKAEILLEHGPGTPAGPLPVSLIHYRSGEMDLHSQTGENHDKAIEAARRILWKRGLSVGPADTVWPSGIYYPVKRCYEPPNIDWEPPI